MAFAPPAVGRYNPITSTLRLDNEQNWGASREIMVGTEGRLKAVLANSGDIPQSELSRSRLPQPVGEKGRRHVMRQENFGRFNPVTHTLKVGEKAIPVGSEGRLNAVMDSGVLNDSTGPKALGMAPNEYAAAAWRGGMRALDDIGNSSWTEPAPSEPQHEHHKKGIPRREQFGRFDPLTHTLAFVPPKGGPEQNVSVGNGGRLRAVLATGTVDSAEATSLGLEHWEPRTGGRVFIQPRPEYDPLSHRSDGPPSVVRPSVDEQRRGRRNRTIAPADMPVDPITRHPHSMRPARLRELDNRTLGATNFKMTHLPSG